ncbi:TetR/AcrR family transcriptional regulator [Microbacterium dextranolyticum]|nr:TetR/AcrR family transcriptional regulator [Microbacterium dextranolyticum]MBM7462595.1 TetR/AcrR family transcriptional repressor of mexJK operon [Microbacterium dextranolyticum]
MTTDTVSRPLRQGQAHKRAAILTAARELFGAAGVERTSMDAVAQRAGVSKRTVYDYYGDKRGLLLGTIEDAGEAALATLRRLIAEHLGDDADIRGSAGLERALGAFAADLGTSLLASSDYRAVVTLIAENEPLLPELEDHPLDAAHAHALTERIRSLAAAGLVDVDDPALAAEHFVALTILRVLNEPPSRRSDTRRIRQIMSDGTRAFLRAYAARPGESAAPSGAIRPTMEDTP